MDKTLRLINPRNFKFRSRNFIIDKQVHHKQQRQNMTCNHSVPIKINKTPERVSSKLNRFQTVPSTLCQESETLKQLRYICTQSSSNNFLSDFDLITPIKADSRKCSSSLNTINSPCRKIQKAVKLKQSFNKKRDMRLDGFLISIKKTSNNQLSKALNISHKSIENSHIPKIKEGKLLRKEFSSSNHHKPKITKEGPKKDILDNAIGPW